MRISMASAGSSFHHTALVSTPLGETTELLITKLSSARGYTVSATEGSLLLKRRYVPNWALLVALVGVFVFFLGLLALFVREEESATILLAAHNGGSRVIITGMVNDEMREKLLSTLSIVSVKQAANPNTESERVVKKTKSSPSIPNEDQASRLLRMAELRDKGVLTAEEFEAGKKQILGETT